MFVSIRVSLYSLKICFDGDKTPNVNKRVMCVFKNKHLMNERDEQSIQNRQIGMSCAAHAHVHKL